MVITKSRREDLPLGEIQVGKFTSRVSPRYTLEVTVEGKSQPDILLGVVRWKSSTWRVRNGVLDVKCDSAARAGFRPIKPEETLARERHRGVRDVLWEEGFS